MRINRKILLPLLIVALLVLGIVGAVLVYASQPAPDTVEAEDDEGEVESQASASEATLTRDEAIAIAEAETGSTAAFVELENENNTLVYSVELEDGSEIEIDASTGDILEIEGAGADSD